MVKEKKIFYYVLRSDPTAEDFADKLEDVLEKIQQQDGLVFFLMEDENLTQYTRVRVWIEARKRGKIKLVDDYATPVQYLIVEEASLDDVLKIEYNF
jgi:hypothetical protein